MEFSFIMKFLLITAYLNYGFAIPIDKKMLEIDKMPCHPEALEVRLQYLTAK